MPALLYPTQTRKISLICLFILCLPAALFAQNLFPQKIDVCNPTDYCVDCGSPKATCSQYTLDLICDNINRKFLFRDSGGSITFQVLVEPSGFSCVMSHTDATTSPLTPELIRYLNGCLWKPAIVNGKAVTSSVNVIFTIAYGKISAHMQRLDLSELTPPGDPVIYNKTAVYTNPSLKNYDFKVWTRYNSPLPDNISQAFAIDKADVLWYASAKGLTRFDGQNFDPVNEYNSPFNSQSAIQDIVIDKKNDKWVYSDKKIYQCTDSGWRVYDFKKFLAAGVTRILNSRNELLFTTKTGLVVVRNNKVVVLSKKTIPQLPSSNIYYAYVDNQKRIWIGTSKGSIMMDGNLIPTAFNATNTPLKNACISGAAEDENGNIYFSLISCNRIQGDNDKEGIAVLQPNGTWLHYNDKNSGMPSNRVNSLLYDKFDRVLWMGTDQSGIVRFNLKDGWENYHNHNSTVPGYKIHQLAQDSKGIIYVSTANGLLRIVRKAGG